MSKLKQPVDFIVLLLFMYTALSNKYVVSTYRHGVAIDILFGNSNALFPNAVGIHFKIYQLLISVVVGMLLIFLFAEIFQKVTLKFVILLILLLLIVIVPSLNEMKLRQLQGPNTHAHDGGVIQVEEAMKFLLRGTSPYSVDYSDTPMGEWVNGGDENPALTHFPYLPSTIYFSIPFKIVYEAWIGYFDERIIYIFVLIAMVYMVNTIAAKEKKSFAIIVLLFNPLIFDFLVYGMNDLITVFWLLLTVYLLHKQKVTWATIMLGIACTTKVFAWLFIPFYFLLITPYDYAGFSIKQVYMIIKNILLSKELKVFLLTVGIIMIPFLLFSGHDLIDDVFLFNTGRSAVSYPIKGNGGFGFASIVLLLGFVGSPNDYFPFIWIQILILVPVLVYLLYEQLKNNTVSNALIGFVATLLMFVYFSRFFHRNYFIYIVIFLIVAWALPSPIEGISTNKNTTMV